MVLGALILAGLLFSMPVALAQPAPQTGEEGEPRPVDAPLPGQEPPSDDPGPDAGPASGEQDDAQVIVGDEGEPPPAFGATATVEELDPVATAISREAPRRVPGAFGDPYRVFESMPGATPMVSGLPYFYVRGSPPSGNAYFYDGIPMPQLFHLGVGPSVLHPMFLGKMTFEPGVSDARYGRRLGAVMAAGPPPPVREAWGEAELRLLDANAAVAAPIGDGDIMVAGRFGYPGLITPALGIDLSFSYWDYQLRSTIPLDADDRIQVVALGSRDTLSNAEALGAATGYTAENPRLELEFHRIEARLERKRRDFSVGTALRLGYDRSQLGGQVAAEGASFAPRVWLTRRLPGNHRIRAGADLTGMLGRVQELPLAGSFAQDAAQAVTRNTGGAYVDVTLPLAPWSTLMLGLRTDAWIVQDRFTPSLDPRVRWTVYPTEELDLHAGAGLVHQPVVFAFPLPAFTDVAVDRGLQEGIQAEVGGGYDLLGEARFETNLFLHRYSDLLIPEVYLRALGDDAARVDALAYGIEVFLVRASHHALSGWFSYTLGFAHGIERDTGRTFDPEFDIRHVLNLVADLELGAGWYASMGLRLRSGKPVNQATDAGVPPPYDVRLPAFARIDGRLGYTFPTAFGRMEIYAEVLNMTLAREAIDVECLFGTCEVVEAQAIWFPNLGIRAGF